MLRSVLFLNLQFSKSPHLAKPFPVSRNTIPTMFQKISLIFLLLILINCSKESKDEFKRKENFIRDWKVIRYPYSNAILSIYANHEFKYSETGHLSESYSEGIWDLNNDTLTLNSLQPNECLIIDDFSLNISENYDKMRMTSKNCEPKPNSKIFTEFINAKFLIKKDSLNYLNLNPEYQKKYGNYKIF